VRRKSDYEAIGITHIGTILAEAIGDAAKVREALGVWPAWQEAVGPQIAAAAKPVSLKNGVLVVHVRHSVWMQELVAMRETLLRRIRRVASARVVRELKFRVAPLPSTSPVVARSAPPLQPRAPIPYEVAQAIRRIDSPRLRAVMLRVASRWAALPR
jgi:hypothetical protein